jgi:hypothetical protein
MRGGFVQPPVRDGQMAAHSKAASDPDSMQSNVLREP